MKRYIPAVLLLSAYFILSCSSAMNIIEADAWLASKADAASPTVDITGKWQDAEYDYSTSWNALGWGVGELVQKGANVSGIIGNYEFKGMVSGKKIYFVALYGGKVYYTANFEMNDNKELVGNYYDAKDKEQKAPYPMRLKRTK